MALKFLGGSVTQGSADAFATAEIATGLSNANLAYRVRGIVWNWASPVEVDAAYYAQLVRRTPAALVGLADRTLLWAQRWTRQITTSGTFLQAGFEFVSFPRDFDLIIVEDPIYLSIDSDTSGLANVLGVRIYYEEQRITELEKVRALAESLNA